MDRARNVPESGLRRFPRIILYVVLPLLTLAAYLILLLGCLTNTFRDFYLAEFQSNGQTPIGGSLLQVDLRVGYLGVCFGPRTFYCTVTGLGTKTVTQITRELPTAKSGGTVALASLAQALQSNFLVPSGFGLGILLFVDLVANIMEVAVDEPAKAEKRAKAAIWVRSIDWATAAAATVALADYISLVTTIPNLIRVAFIEQVNIQMGTAGLAIHGTIAGVALLSAAIKTFLASEDLQLKDVTVTAVAGGKGLEGGYDRPIPPRRPTPLGIEVFGPVAPYETRFNRGDRMSRIKSAMYRQS